LLKDNDVVLRRAAAKALGEIGPRAKAAIPALTELLKDNNREVREAAASALGRSTPEMKATEADTKKIKRLIADLAAIDSPDVGLSPTMAGSAFAPIASSEHFGEFLFTEHGLKRNAAFTSLVELGPTALPFLLESLDDKTPTKLTIGHDFVMGDMSLGHEISGNPFNTQEAKVLADVNAEDDLSFLNDQEHTIDRYTVKIGDVCFAAIGQITNRSYNAVRYQPTACVVVNSTVEDKKLAAEVRAIWGQSDHRQKLLDSLLLDFHTQGLWHGELQTGAAMRLAYYFPQATEDFIVARLKELQITAYPSKPGQLPDTELADLLRSVAWSPSPKFRAVFLEIFRKTNDPDALLAALPNIGKEHGELIFRRIAELLDSQPTNEPGPCGEGYYLLIALGNRFPDRAEGVLRNYLKPGTIGRRRVVANALQETCGHLAIKLLAPLLEDKRDTDSRYNIHSGWSGPSLPVRLCDEAAATIAMHSKALRFVMEGSHENLDRQIATMRRQIAEMNAPK
jgi:hypothetical protein